MNIRSLALMGLASLNMASSVQANFFSWKRDTAPKLKNSARRLFVKRIFTTMANATALNLPAVQFLSHRPTE